MERRGKYKYQNFQIFLSCLTYASEDYGDFYLLEKDPEKCPPVILIQSN